ncbi:MAG: glutaminyl-tRNA synthase (glutamine-hydrolyzing) subunit A [Sphingobacteriia bacterium 24-36-13]|jgi:aspartyl-tRNA(Asn)/glutamyl-tRNA(Gln) amidotransferase subunit A|uniref:Asp-tRNA(Asn)/Glu-tRNA(Gln) amidotransferase subunit GatA n=1 Tax=Sediminibacterium sp. TaxID=1917865 RepID=UPI000BC7F838|nr:Asp-tRNA(Asn)/Glu-tRNA(Gln) amidotransferase subunit GatA [Sediminibacterium sp.]OYY09410.1 MAG: glutaminyl-tRNA synthase (glutamine-hydrolyzing) subunit A [Sphingobacteriia bacterium 35-36-14]OYZ54653.1 MAG: glutaminyl-tRNA synthase (glutamine-hydrolyzing) subunit A [Sphingobacteriia bacterium 24-36-13]HQS24941.1 Asp-tRNA(Asn)/Glu-tRNA(Gln) amidotransferase subunit GatA [Sediminibacterium sp.]HQS35499.1 Asp-tRNA(Asn)/Glu-tRNA(Gln) amidotransferase subunit GatA [Sediminibacterium sp.]
MFGFTTIKAFHTALQNGQTTCVEAVLFYTKAIAEHAHLNAFLEVYETEAVERAKQLDAAAASGALTGPLHGVVVGLKDVIAHKGHTLTASSKMLGNFESVYNATVTEKLLAAGAIIIGRQNCDEFAMGSSNENSAFGPVRNAADTNKVSGGSSGGSAVAVQAGLCMISLGSDTGGSVRQPADFCGVVGIKPSYGRISRYGLIAYASSFDQIGIFSSTVEDAALVLEVIAGADEYDSTVSQRPVEQYSSVTEAPEKKYKIAYFKEALNHPSLDPAIQEQTFAFIKSMQAAGHIVEAIDFNLLEYVVPTYYVLTTAEASSNLSRYDGVRFGHRTNKEGIDLTEMYKASRSEGFGEEVKRRILLGTFVLSEGFFDAYFTKAQQVRQLLKQRTDAIFSEYDAILSPTVPATAFNIGAKSDDPIEMFLADIYTVYPNLVGIPAISIPLFTHPNGMPFGLQLMTRSFDEMNLLQLSAQLMELKS